VRRALSIVSVFAGFAALGSLASLGLVRAAAPAAAAPAGSNDYTKVSPLDLVKQTPKGKIQDPYKDTQADIVAQGETLFRSYSCSGCHGGTGGGGMCPPVTNDTWVYGGDDDTLFRLVTLGSDELQKDGYSRTGRENVVGPMPPFGSIVKNSDDLFKIITFIRAHYDGDPAYKFGAPKNP
jgi:mono/diheme cytochrome c family protein